MKIDTIAFIQSVSIFSAIAPLIFYLVRFKISPRQNHIIGGFIIVCGIFDFMLGLRLFSVVILCNLQDVLQFFLLTWFYYELVYKKRADLVMLVSIGTYMAVLFACMYYMGISQNYSFAWTAASIIFTIHAMVYFFTIPKMVIDRYFDTNFFSNLIFNAALFFYFSMTILIFFMVGDVIKSEDATTIRAFWGLHNIFNILKNIGLAIGFYYTGKRQIYMTMEQLERIARKLKEEVNP
jgi:hypothetical protein